MRRKTYEETANDKGVAKIDLPETTLARQEMCM
jgi:hypothetical protein